MGFFFECELEILLATSIPILIIKCAKNYSFTSFHTLLLVCWIATVRDFEICKSEFWEFKLVLSFSNIFNEFLKQLISFLKIELSTMEVLKIY